MSFQDYRDLEAGRGSAQSRRDPTQAVASGIFQITTAVSTFQRLVNTIGTPKDTPELREKLHKTRLHIGQLVKDTSEKLKLASERDHHTEVIFYSVGSLKECWKYKAVNQQVASPPMPLVYQK